MSSASIVIQVDPAIASAYAAASPEQKRKLDALLSLKLAEWIAPTRDLESVMEEMGRQASTRGLTPTKLDELLQDEWSKSVGRIELH